jgi:toxin-antitoxin system PIN domain toxin
VTAYLCDINVWLALTLSAHQHGGIVREWFDGIEDGASILFCRATQQSYLRLLTTASVLASVGDPPLTNAQAWAAYEQVTADNRVLFLAEEPEGLEGQWRTYAVRETPSPKIWGDAYLAAFACAGKYQLVTTDADFRQYPGLDLVLLA